MAMTALAIEVTPLMGQQALLDLTYSVGAAALLGGSHAGLSQMLPILREWFYALFFRNAGCPSRRRAGIEPLNYLRTRATALASVLLPLACGERRATGGLGIDNLSQRLAAVVAVPLLQRFDACVCKEP